MWLVVVKKQMLKSTHIALPDLTHMSRCAGDSTCIDKAKVCDFKSDCKDASDEALCGPCNFEKGTFCGWKDISSGKFNWTVYNDRSSSNSMLQFL